MGRPFLTDQQVEEEIARLKASPMVALDKVENRLKNKRRQYLYTLRQYERRDIELTAAGVTAEALLSQERELKRTLKEGRERNGRSEQAGERALYARLYGWLYRRNREGAR